MHITHIFIFLSISTALALDFQVVVPGATSVQVSIGGTNFALAPKWAGVGYFKGSVSGISGTPSYKYIADGVAENFDRVFPSGRSKTYNDFYGRQATIQETTPFGWPFTEQQQWERAKGPNDVFDKDYISTVIFVGQQFQQDMATVSAKTDYYNVTVVMINKDENEMWNDCKVHVEDTSQLKPNMNFKLTSNYKKRSTYKLRPSVADPVFMRDHLYNNILQAVGCPHQEASFTRVYVNGVGLGLYNLMEKVGSGDFIKTQFYGNKVAEPAVLGVPLDATTGADFAQGTPLSAFVPPGNSSNAAVQLLINALEALDTSSVIAIQNFDRDWWSIEHFFRAMALEYLSGHYDSYWFMTTNFVVYDDPTEGSPGTKRYYFIDQDFDQTFGVNLSPVYNPYGANYTSIPYTEYVNKNWSVVGSDAPNRTMIDKLLLNPTYRDKFEEILKTIVKGIWNPPALNRHIDSLSSRLRPELAWDYGLGIENRAHHGNESFRIVWTIQDFDNGMTQMLRGNWGLKTFISERANFVANQFGIQFINPPLDPPAPAPTTTGSQATSQAGSTTQQAATTLASTTIASTTVAGTTTQQAGSTTAAESTTQQAATTLASTTQQGATATSGSVNEESSAAKNIICLTSLIALIAVV